VAGEINPVGVVDDAIENGVGIGGIADQLVPFVDGNLAGDDRRAAAVAFFENLEEIVTSGGIEGLETPVVEDEQLYAAERALDAGIAAIAAGEREVGEELAARRRLWSTGRPSPPSVLREPVMRTPSIRKYSSVLPPEVLVPRPCNHGRDRVGGVFD